jgi:hypothetical protein
MPRQRKRTHTSDDNGLRKPKAKSARQVADERDERNKRRFTDEWGIVAQDLPDARHGRNVVDSPKEMRRNLPQQHGGTIGEHREGGLASYHDIGAARRAGGRKKN